MNEYGKHLPDLVKSKSSYKNYREFLLKVLECRRDERNIPFDAVTAQAYADELYKAGEARTIGKIFMVYCHHENEYTPLNGVTKTCSLTAVPYDTWLYNLFF